MAEGEFEIPGGMLKLPGDKFYEIRYGRGLIVSNPEDLRF